MTIESSSARDRVNVFAQQLESLWATWDRYLAQVPADTWRKRYGSDWRFADVPYHMAYYDRVHVIETIQKGADLPKEERWCLLSYAMTTAWNRREFAKRRPGQTPAESIAGMRAERERVRAILSWLTDADLARPAFNHFLSRGWSTVEEALRDCRTHHWSELFEFAYRLTGRRPEFSPEAEHAGIEYYMQLFPLFLDPEAAKRVPSFTVVWDTTGPAGGAWTVRVDDGKASLERGRADRPDLVLTLSPETFLLLFKGIKKAPVLMLTRKMRVKGFRKLGTFGKLFAPPKPDREVPLPAAGHPFVAG